LPDLLFVSVRRQSASSEQYDQEDDHQDQAEASTIVVEGGTGIETAAAEKKYQNDD
jgi:hypothetical protein